MEEFQLLKQLHSTARLPESGTSRPTEGFEFPVILRPVAQHLHTPGYSDSWPLETLPHGLSCFKLSWCCFFCCFSLFSLLLIILNNSSYWSVKSEPVCLSCPGLCSSNQENLKTWTETINKEKPSYLVPKTKHQDVPNKSKHWRKWNEEVKKKFQSVALVMYVFACRCCCCSLALPSQILPNQIQRLQRHHTNTLALHACACQRGGFRKTSQHNQT